MKRFPLLLIVGVLAWASAPPAKAVGLIVVDEAHWQPNPLPAIPPGWPGHPRPPRPHPPMFMRPHVFAPLQLELCKAEVQVKDQVAVTTLEQVFRNPNSQRLEGTFLFPVPKAVHLDQFTMQVDGESVEAELLDADKARKIYEDIVRRAKDPALLEYDGQDVFRVRVFPVEGNATKRITLRYTQLLKLDNGLVGYTLPLTSGKFSSAPIKTLAVNVRLKCKQPIKILYSPTHTVEIKHDGGRRATVGYEGSDLQPDTDFALYFSADGDKVGINLMSYQKGDKDGHFLLLASPGVDVSDESIVPKDITFVIDTSGSMSGKKLEQAKKALVFCVENLNAGDRFEIIRFSTEVDPLFGTLTEIDRRNREKAKDFVQGFKAIGGTAIDEALKRALTLPSSSLSAPSLIKERHGVPRETANRPFVIVFLTDGLPTVGITSGQRILDNVKDRSDGKVRVFCFGVGTDVNTHLLDKITEHTRATSQYILPDEDLEIKVSNFVSKINDPVLANPVVRFEGNKRAFLLHPSELPDLFRGEQLVVVGRYDRPGKVKVVLEGMVNGRTAVFEQTITIPKHADEHVFIARLWANRRVGYLLDQIRLHGESPELKDEVVTLAREYGIVTPYTAYLILEDEAGRRVPAAAQSLPQFREDRMVREQIQRMGLNYGKDVSGEMAVNAARVNSSIRSVSSLADSSASLHEAAGVLAPASPLAPGSGGVWPNASDQPLVLSTQFGARSQFVGGRNFYLNDGRWVDAQVQLLPEANHVKLQFGSEEYFKLVAGHVEVRPWLAQGANVEFVLNGTIYEIHE